jgi:peroxiredoxin
MPVLLRQKDNPVQFHSTTKRSSLFLALSALLLIGPAASLGAAPAKKAEPAAKQPDAFAVPDGTPEELVKFLQKLSQMTPPAQDPQTVADYSKKLGTAALQAAEKLLAAKPNDQQAAYAVYVKLEVLPVLDQVGDKDAFAKLQAMPRELEKQGRSALARVAGRRLLLTRLARAENADPAQFKKLLDEIKKFLAAAPLEPDDSLLAVSAGLAAERLDRAGLAVKVYEDFAKLFSADKDPRMVRFGAKLQGAARRLMLVGKPMEIQGATPDGRPLDWAKYRGKVVLVVFWATESVPSRVELVNILQNYEAYHDGGLEVVAISTDQVKADLTSFLAENRLPWIVLYDQALYSDAADKTMDTRYGIITVPELILVGKDGKVLSISVRGPALARELAKLLGAAETPKPKSADAKQAGDSSKAPEQGAAKKKGKTSGD